LQPLGMDRSVFYVEELGADDNCTMLYTPRVKDGVREVLRAPGWWDSPSMLAAGFLKSTARDMLRYADVYRTGGASGDVRVISEESASQMTAAHIKTDLVRSYGYGLGTQSFHEKYTLIQHTGGLKGITSVMFIIPEAGLTGVVLTNVDDAPISNLVLGLLNSLFERPLETPLTTFAPYEAPLARLQESNGTYKSGEGDEVKIRFDEENKQLVFAAGSEDLPLRPIGEDSFLLNRNNIDMQVRFVRNSEGQVKRFVMGGRQMPKVEA